MLATKALSPRLGISLGLLVAAVSGCGGPPADGSPGAGGLSGADGAGSGAATASGGSPGEVVTLPGGLELTSRPEYFRVVRLTHEQWENSVRDVLQLPAAPGLSSGFSPDPPDGKFSNNERALFVSDSLWTDYQRTAEKLAETVASDAGALAKLSAPSDSTGFIAAVGERAFRRALTPDEQSDYAALWTRGAEFFASGNAFADGARVFLEALLQSPHFLYRIELSGPGSRLSGAELATKLSYLLRDTTPNAELLAQAASGTLDTDAGLAAVVSEMLDEAGARAVVERFHRELFGLDRYASILKSTTKFPNYDESLNEIFLEADLLFFSRVYSEDFGLREILTSNVAFVNAATAPLYDLTATGTTLREVTVGEDRPGFLTRLGFLAYNATLNDPDPIHRGVDINNRLLCAHLTPPPGEIPPLPDPIPGQTNRERVEAHTGKGFCGSCHGNIINPPGFALENFDALGQTRTTDNNKPVDTTGSFSTLGGTMSFASITDLTSQLAENQVAHSCFVANLAEFVFARDVGTGEVPLLSGVQEQSHAGNASIKAMLLAMIQSPQFTNARTVP